MSNVFTIGLDLGTSGSKAVALGCDDNIVAKASVSVEYNVDGLKAEFDICEYYEQVCCLIRHIISQLPTGSLIEGICISSASGNTVLLNKDDMPLVPAISWTDTRFKDEIKQVFGELDSNAVLDMSGWPLADYLAIAHLSWYRVHNPKLLDNAYRIGTSTDYVNLRLCDKWAIDNSSATTFYLQDQKNRCWNSEYIGKLGISHNQLPELLPVGTKIGEITSKAADETSLPVGTPVFLGSFDHPSAAIGAGVIKEGQLLLSCGTSWVGFIPIKDRELIIKNNLMADPFLSPNGCWGGYFSLDNVASRIERYLPDVLPEKFDNLIMNSPKNSKELKINPYNEPDDSLASYSDAEIALALMKGIADLFALEINKLVNAGIKITDITMVGGPSKSVLWPDILRNRIGYPLNISPYENFAGAVGAAKICRKTKT